MTSTSSLSASPTRRRPSVSIRANEHCAHCGSLPAVTVYLESPEIPARGSDAHDDDDARSAHSAAHTANVPVLNDSTLVARTPGRGGKDSAVSIHRVTPNHVTSADEFAEAGGVSGGGRDSLLYPPAREPAPQPGYSKPVVPDFPTTTPGMDAMSVRSGKTGRTGAAPSIAPSTTPSHKLAFQEFHSTLGVRLLKGSLGPVQDVPMMLKSGYRHVYVSRSFALNHGFIPKDTTPGTYGFNGITNLGKWPVQVGSKAVPCTVMLAEDSYFPVILGRSFMEKRGVRTGECGGDGVCDSESASADTPCRPDRHDERHVHGQRRARRC